CETAPSRKSTRAGAATDCPVFTVEIVSVAMNGRDASRMQPTPSCCGWGISAGGFAAAAGEEQPECIRTDEIQTNSHALARMRRRLTKSAPTSRRDAGSRFNWLAKP